MSGGHSSYYEVSRSWFVFSAVLSAIIGFTTPLAFCLPMWYEARQKDEPLSIHSGHDGLVIFFGRRWFLLRFRSLHFCSIFERMKMPPNEPR